MVAPGRDHRLPTDPTTWTCGAAAAIEAIAAEGLPVAHSTDAGEHLCNYVFYRLLAEAHAPRTAFLHLPPDLPVEDLARGAAAAALIAGD